MLALAFGLRAFIAWRGGQLFWPDEDRFEVARKVAAILLDGRIHEAASLLFSQPDHVLFKVAALVPAALEGAIGFPGWVSALFFAAASTWVLWLVARVARAAGASAGEGLVALILAASTTSLFYYSRHFLPYDFALGLFLTSLLTGLRDDTSARTSLLTGLWAGLGFLAYNGYWSLGAILLAAHVLLALPQPRAMATRCTFALLGLALPIFCVTAVARLLGHDFFALTIAFAGTANQGELDHPVRFAADFFWVSEHGLAGMWALGLLLAVVQLVRAPSRRTILWPGLILALGLLLLVPPAVFHHFALTARHLRVLTPLLALATAAALCRLPALHGRPRLLIVALVLVGLQTGYNFAAPLTQVFPREFEAEAALRLNEWRRTDVGLYKLVNVSFLHDPDSVPAGPDAGRVLLRARHPFEFEPYLFEGYSTPIRERYLERDRSMRVVRLDAGGPPMAGYPNGMLELTLKFPSAPRGLLPEPLLTTGGPGRGDTLFLRYTGLDQVVVGHDHIGGGATLAPVLPLDRQASHRVLVFFSTFFAPGTDARPVQRFVLWNEQVLLAGPAELHPTTPEQIAIGQNYVGTSTAIRQLTAEIVSLRRIPFARLGAAFTAPPGALRLRLLLHGAQPGQFAEPLLSSGPAGQGDLLFIRREADGQFRLGHDKWGGNAQLSAPFAVDTSRSAEFLVAMGPFLGGTAAGTDGGLPAHRLFARHGAHVIFNRLVTFNPSAVADLSVGDNRAASTSVGSARVAEFLACDPLPASALLDPPFAAGQGLRLKLRFFGPMPRDRADPIVSLGRSGAGDLLFIRFDGAGRYQIGHDHWGYNLALSEPQALPADGTVELTISLGPLHSPAGPPALRERLYVATADGPLLDRPAGFHPASVDSWTVGFNRIEASTAGQFLGADVLEQAAVPADEILARVKP